MASTDSICPSSDQHNLSTMINEIEKLMHKIAYLKETLQNNSQNVKEEIHVYIGILFEKLRTREHELFEQVDHLIGIETSLLQSHLQKMNFLLGTLHNQTVLSHIHDENIFGTLSTKYLSFQAGNNELFESVLQEVGQLKILDPLQEENGLNLTYTPQVKSELEDEDFELVNFSSSSELEALSNVKDGIQELKKNHKTKALCSADSVIHIKADKLSKFPISTSFKNKFCFPEKADESSDCLPEKQKKATNSYENTKTFKERKPPFNSSLLQNTNMEKWLISTALIKKSKIAASGVKSAEKNISVDKDIWLVKCIPQHLASSCPTNESRHPQCSAIKQMFRHYLEPLNTSSWIQD